MLPSRVGGADWRNTIERSELAKRTDHHSAAILKETKRPVWETDGFGIDRDQACFFPERAHHGLLDLPAREQTPKGTTSGPQKFGGL
jgi:hypothetical protein